jgi:hypothetical protein
LPLDLWHKSAGDKLHTLSYGQLNSVTTVMMAYSTYGTSYLVKKLKAGIGIEQLASRQAFEEFLAGARSSRITAGLALDEASYNNMLETFRKVKGTKTASQAVDLFDELTSHFHVEELDKLLSRNISAEQLSSTLRHALLAGGDNRKVLALISEMPDGRSLQALSDKLQGLGNVKSSFYADLADADFFAGIKNYLNLVDSWRALNNIGVDDVIRKNPDYLKNIDDYAKRSGKNADEVAGLAKNNKNGVEQFLDELENTPSSGHWDKNPFQRGKDIEDILGQNLPETFKTIDKFDNGIATSIKSLDVDAKTYQNISKLKSRLTKYVDELDGFTGYSLEGINIGNVSNGAPITAKRVELAIPKNGTSAQMQAINDVVNYANQKGITLITIIVP